MTLGFSDPKRLAALKCELETWELYQVQIDKFHVMFWFENGHCLLNVAYRFEFVSATPSQSFVYDVQAPGSRKFLCVDPILRQRIQSVYALDNRRLALEFKQGDLIIHDSPEIRSAWFYRYNPIDHDSHLLWFVEDQDKTDS